MSDPHEMKPKGSCKSRKRSQERDFKVRSQSSYPVSKVE
jgi:hypothetical protein